MNRFKELKDILNRHQYFKIVCGAGNEDYEEVYKLSLIYTLAGATAIDVSANVDVVKSSVRGINKAFEIASKAHRIIKTRPFINVSIGMRGDPHIRKAIIDLDICSKCGLCVENCIQKAILTEYKVIERRCIGCGICAKVCGTDAIKFFDNRKELKNILPDCLKHGAETFELHAIIPDDESVMEDWKLMNDILPDNFISMCLDRSQLSDSHVVKRLKAAHEITKDRFMIQADGVPMSGDADDYNTTLQAIAIADIVRKNKIQGMLLASGGTNSKTGKLARLCGIELNGVAIGTYARKLVSGYIQNSNFDENIDLVSKAVSVAGKLITDNISEIRHG